MKLVLITGAGSGFGLEVAMRLSGKGLAVFASVAIYDQVQLLKRSAAAQDVKLKAKRTDVTSEADRQKALGWAQVTPIRSDAVTKRPPSVLRAAESRHG